MYSETKVKITIEEMPQGRVSVGVQNGNVPSPAIVHETPMDAAKHVLRLLGVQLSRGVRLFGARSGKGVQG